MCLQAEWIIEKTIIIKIKISEVYFLETHILVMQDVLKENE